MSDLQTRFSPAALACHVAWGAFDGAEASFSSGIDRSTGTVRVIGSGIWGHADAERYFVDQGQVVRKARQLCGALKVFFDVREWVVQGPESATQFQDYNRKLYLPADRLVAVVMSSAAKQHPRTALCVGSPECFVSLSAAETWLQAYSSDLVCASR